MSGLQRGEPAALWNTRGFSREEIETDLAHPRISETSAHPSVRLAQLDRVLDLFDAARFSADVEIQSMARNALWGALGTSGGSRGEAATREALSRMLREAWAIEDAKPGLADRDSDFLADFIALVSVDLNFPNDADGLAIRTLVYRNLAREGHPRIADNARWRLYDHVRGVLVGAVEAGTVRGSEIAIHALYAAHEDISEQLKDVAPHTRPRRPSPQELWDLLSDQHEALTAMSLWAPVVRSRHLLDERLRPLVLEGLTQPRNPSWLLAHFSAGTGHQESLGPIVLLEHEKAILAPTSPRPFSSSVSDGRFSKAVEAAMARDGRGILLLAANPMLPSPVLHRTLAQLAEARVDTVEFAILEPRIPESTGDVIVALPMIISRKNDISPAGRALHQARIKIHLVGRGAHISIDDRWLSFAPASLEATLQDLRLAYPREKAVALTLDPDVLMTQLLNLIAALGGGLEPRFSAVGWLAERPLPDPSPTRGADDVFDRRVQLGNISKTPQIDQPYPLQPDDQSRLEMTVAGLTKCLPELEKLLPRAGVTVDLVFNEGRLVEAELPHKKKVGANGLALERCIQEEFWAFRLRHHRDRVTATVHFSSS